MAVIKTSALVDEIKGSIGGTVFQVSKWGQIAKAKSSRKPNTSLLSNEQRDRTSYAVSAYRALSVANRATWTTNAPVFPTTDRYGNSVISTGYNLFMRVALQYSVAFIRTMTTCPGLLAGYGTWSAAPLSNAGQIRVQLTRSGGAGNCFISVFASPMYEASISNPRKRYRRILVLNNQSASLTADVSSQYESKFGPIENGKTIYFQMRSSIMLSPQSLGSSEWSHTTSGF